MIALCYFGSTFGMPFVNLQCILNIFLEIVVLNKADKSWSSAQINICNFHPFLTIKFQSDVQGMLVKCDHFVCSRWFIFLNPLGIVRSNNCINKCVKHWFLSKVEFKNRKHVWKCFEQGHFHIFCYVYFQGQQKDGNCFKRVLPYLLPGLLNHLNSLGLFLLV